MASLSRFTPLGHIFGVDVRSVRIQTDSITAERLGARAFAFGDQIHFAPGQFDPSTAEGWRVIGHELAHVVQQRLGYVPAGSGIVDDPCLEREAHAAGELAASMFITGRAPSRPLHSGPIPQTAQASAIQCLMSLADFKTASSASGLRNKVKVIDRELEAFHTLDKTPRNYVALLAKIRALYAVCDAYIRTNPDSARNTGIKKLQREIGYEETVLAPLAKYAAEADVVKAWEFLEQAQENLLQVESRPEFTRENCNIEILQLISALKQRSHGTPADAAMVARDIDELKKLADRESMPATLKSIILEATNAANTRQLDLKVWMPGAAYNTANGAVQKYTLKHELEQGLGRKWRLGSLLHELTHISIAEIFDNTKLMFAIKKDATDDEIIAFASLRKAKINALQQKIDAAPDLEETLKKEMKDKAKYPLSGKLAMYLANFKKQLGDAEYDRFAALCRRGMDCELIEYDTVINQMALWCALSKVNETQSVYAELLVLAKEAALYRANARLAPPRPLVRRGSMSDTKPLASAVGVGGRRGSF